MKKVTMLMNFVILLTLSTLSFAATLESMSKTQIEHAFINKTFTSIATDNLNGQTVDNSNIVYLDDKGNALGKMSLKPADAPQIDKGIYSINDDGTLYIKWQHWDGAKQLCFYMFETQNAFIAIDCNNVFHSVFMKAAVKPGNQLQ